MFNRVIKIEEAIKEHNEIIDSLRKELKHILRQCQHSNKQVSSCGYGVANYRCKDCGDDWSD